MKKEITDYMFKQKENNTFHTPQSLEVLITDAIATGNMARLHNIFKNSYEGSLGILSLKHERQERYMFVTAAAVFSRAAMRGGIDYELACSMADIYCQKMDQLSLSNDFMYLMFEMGFDFCRTVSETNKLVYSPLINKCCTYIYNHTHETVSLYDLAELCNMSTRRLSERFKKETGTSIVDYIQLSKIEEAEVLLRYTSKTISEISSYLAFSTQSYFTLIFKKHTGITPLEYKKNSNELLLLG